MPNLKLTLACWDYDRTRPLIDGRVKPEGIDLDIQILRPRQTFQRMLDTQEFDVSELSLASYTALKGRGAVPVRGGAGRAVENLPPLLHLRARRQRHPHAAGPARQARRHLAVFLDRPRLHARHAAARLRRQRRGHALVHGRAQQLRRAAAHSAQPAAGRSGSTSSPPGKRLESMFDAGELDALLSLYIPKSFLDGAPHVARLFPNFKEVEQDYYRRTKIFPIMHTVVLREDIFRAHPWAAKSIYRAFCEARDLAVERSLRHRRAARRVAVADRPCRGDVGGCSARISGPMGLSRTGRPSRRSAATSTSRGCRRGW